MTIHASFNRRTLLGTAAGITAFAVARPVLASSDQQGLVDQARITVDSMAQDPSYGDMRAYMARSVGVMIIPQLLKAGFIIGGSGGDGILVGRDKNGTWSPPAFYTLAAGSIGLQIGAQASEVVLVINHEHGLSAILEDQMKLGADASIAVGPIGSGVEAATTTNMRADIFSYARSKGLFAGVSLEGAAILSSKDWNASYYGRPVNPRDIVVNRTVDNAGASALRTALQGAARA